MSLPGMVAHALRGDEVAYLAESAEPDADTAAPASEAAALSAAAAQAQAHSSSGTGGFVHTDLSDPNVAEKETFHKVRIRENCYGPCRAHQRVQIYY